MIEQTAEELAEAYKDSPEELAKMYIEIREQLLIRDMYIQKLKYEKQTH